MLCVRQINDAHMAVPGLAVVEVAVSDDATAFAIQELLAARCAIAPADRTTREAGEPGVRLRFFLNRTCTRHPTPRVFVGAMKRRRLPPGAPKEHEVTALCTAHALRRWRP